MLTVILIVPASRMNNDRFNTCLQPPETRHRYCFYGGDGGINRCQVLWFISRTESLPCDNALKARHDIGWNFVRRCK